MKENRKIFLFLITKQKTFLLNYSNINFSKIDFLFAKKGKKTTKLHFVA